MPVFPKITIRAAFRPIFIAWATETADRISEAIAGAPPEDQPVADPEELTRLVADFGEAIYRVALSVVRDSSLAEDVAQDTLVKAWLALPTFRGDSSLKSWVLRIAHNTAISTLRLRKSVVMDPFTLPEADSASGPSVERRAETSAAMTDFVLELGKLDELSRSVVVLREVEGLSYDEISEVLDISLSTVKTRLMRARHRLGVALEEWAP